MKHGSWVVLFGILSLSVVGGEVLMAGQGRSSRVASSISANPTFDFSGLDRFWRILDILEQDRDPSTALWDSLLATPGYRALTASEFDPQFFVRSFTLAYKPSLAAELQEALEDPRRGRRLRHYLEVRDRRAELVEQEKRLRSEPVLAAAVTRATRFLAEEVPSIDPPVSFVVFDMDGRGYEPIVMDILASVSLDLESFLAHESHHWYRNLLLAFDPDGLDPEDESLIGVLNQLQAEGIADQIDKAGWLDGSVPVPPLWRRFADGFEAAFAEAPGVLTAIDSILCALNEAPADERRRGGEAIDELVPMSGHPTGFFMADLIARVMGPDHLRQDLGNPLAFCRLYDQAARQADRAAPALSAKALAYLARLERKYIESR